MFPKKEFYIGHLKAALRRNIILLLILVSAAFVWMWIFSSAALTFISTGVQPFRATWNGTGQFDLFGLPLYYNFEGYIDYDYYYYTWGGQFLRGIAPYTSLFDRSTFGHVFYNTPYFFPPLYVYMCAFGRILPIDPFGIGFLISLFGYLTAFPIYGISKFLSNNRRVAEISVLTYLFNPLVLYHTVYEWLNPAPFVFFMVLSFYLLIKGRRISGTLAMITAALFKQAAFFLLLPLVAILIKKQTNMQQIADDDKEEPSREEFDMWGLGKLVVIAAIYVIAVSFPFLFDLGNYLNYIFVVPGGTLQTDLTALPNAGQPMTLAHLLIFLGAPIELIDIVNKATYYGIFLLASITIIFVFMVIQIRSEHGLPKYWRRMLFLTLILMLCVHIFSPRGVYKYYFVALIPFFSILSVSSMISSKTENLKASLSMILNPTLLGLLIIIPNRFLYLAFVILILASYFLHASFSIVHEIASNYLRGMFRRFRRLPQEINSEPTLNHKFMVIVDH